MKKQILGVCVFSFFILNVVTGNIITVTSTADSSSGSLRAAINNLASSGDTIKFALGMYPDTIRLTSGPININLNLTIIGLGDDSTVINGTNSSRIFNIG